MTFLHAFMSSQTTRTAYQPGCFSYDANTRSSNNSGYCETQPLNKTLHLLCISPALIILQLFGEQRPEQVESGLLRPLLARRFLAGRAPISPTDLLRYSPQNSRSSNAADCRQTSRYGEATADHVVLRDLFRAHASFRAVSLESAFLSST